MNTLCWASIGKPHNLLAPLSLSLVFFLSKVLRFCFSGQDVLALDFFDTGRKGSSPTANNLLYLTLQVSAHELNSWKASQIIRGGSFLGREGVSESQPNSSDLRSKYLNPVLLHQ